MKDPAAQLFFAEVEAHKRRIRRDPWFRMEMFYCSEHGIPHSKFLNWDIDDRTKALAFMVAKSEECALCGTAQWEWDESRTAYYPVQHRCQGCYVQKAESENVDYKSGDTIKLEKSTPQSRARQQMMLKERYGRNKE